MGSYLSNRALTDLLVKRGLVPDNCRQADILIDPTGPLVIRYEVFVTAEHLAAVAEVLREVAAETLKNTVMGTEVK
jgi:hypothetical protein